MKILTDDYFNALTKYANGVNEHGADNIPLNPINRDNDSFPLWLQSAVAIWSDGITGNDHVNSTYSEVIHANVLQLMDIEQVNAFGDDGVYSDDANDRIALLDSWIGGEMSHHWGDNSARSNGNSYQATPYRVAQGFSDG